MKKFFRVSDVVARLFHRSSLNFSSPVRRRLGSRKISSDAVKRLVRHLMMENLEDRQMLSVSTGADYDAIRSAYVGYAQTETLENLEILDVYDANEYALQQAVSDTAVTIDLQTSLLAVNSVTANDENSLFEISNELLDNEIYTVNYQTNSINDSLTVANANEELDNYETQIINESLKYTTETNDIDLDQYSISEIDTSVADESAATNYVVIFSGGYNADNNHRRYYDAIKDLYNTAITVYEVDPKNIYILYADGTDPAADMNIGAETTITVNSDMTFATDNGTSVCAATSSNFQTVMTAVGKMMDGNDHLLLYTSDHGGGEEGKPEVTGEETIYAWGESIKGEDFANAVFNVTAGYVTVIETQCFSGGVLANIIDPATGKSLNPNISESDAETKWYGMAAANHYEASISQCCVEYSAEYGAYIYTENGATGFHSGVRTQLATGQDTTTTVFAYAKANDPSAATEEKYDNNAGTYTEGKEHPWGAGAEFSIFADADAQLETPEITKLVSTTTTSITLAFESVANASSYTLEYSTNKDFSDSKTENYNEAGTHNITGLTAKTTYYFRLKANGDGVYTESEWTETESEKTLAVNLPLIDNASFILRDLNDMATAESEGNYFYRTGEETAWVCGDFSNGVLSSTFTVLQDENDQAALKLESIGWENAQITITNDEYGYWTENEDGTWTWSVQKGNEILQREYAAVIWNDVNANGKIDAGEASSNITVTVEWANIAICSDMPNPYNKYDINSNNVGHGFWDNRTSLTESAIFDNLGDLYCYANISEGFGTVSWSTTDIQTTGNYIEKGQFHLSKDGTKRIKIENGAQVATSDFSYLCYWNSVDVFKTFTISSLSDYLNLLEFNRKLNEYFSTDDRININSVDKYLENYDEIQKFLSENGFSPAYILTNQVKDGKAISEQQCMKTSMQALQAAGFDVASYPQYGEPTGNYDFEYEWAEGDVDFSGTLVHFDVTSPGYVGGDLARAGGEYTLNSGRGTVNFTGAYNYKTTLELSTYEPTYTKDGAEITATINNSEYESLVYSWFRVYEDGTEEKIEGSGSTTYTLQKDDVGRKLVFKATPDNWETVLTSLETKEIETDTLIARLSADNPVVGDEISVILYQPAESNAVSSNSVEVTYQWYRTAGTKKESINGATADSYIVANEDCGYNLSCEVKDITGGTVLDTTESTATTAADVETEMPHTIPQPADEIVMTLSNGAAAVWTWYSVDPDTGAETVIQKGTTKETSSTYSVATSDCGKYIKVEAYVENTEGLGEYTSVWKSEVVQSDISSFKAALNTKQVKIGVVLKVTVRDDGTEVTQNLAYQWVRIKDGVSYDITESGNEKTYTVTSADVGYSLKCVVSGTGTYTGTIESDETNTVSAAISAVGIVGDALYGGTLEGSVNPPEATVNYQWYIESGEDYVPIPGAIYSTYSPTLNNVGSKLMLEIEGSGEYAGTTLTAVTETVKIKLVSVGLSANEGLQAGDTITATAISYGDSKNPYGEEEVTYQWYRVKDGTKTIIEGATGTTYTLTYADTGYQIAVEATGQGSYSGTVFSTETTDAVVYEIEPTYYTTSTDMEVGAVLSVDVGSDFVAGKLKFTWYSGTTSVSGYGLTEYTLSGSDIGKKIKVVIEADGLYYPEGKEFTYPKEVTYHLESAVISPSAPVPGKTIEVFPVVPEGTPISEINLMKYQWYRNGVLILGATGKTFEVTDADVGYVLTVIVDSSHCLYCLDSSATASTDMVKVELDSVYIKNENPTVDGVVSVGDTLTAITNPMGVDVTATYQWFRGDGAEDTEIDGATGATYKVTESDLGFKISVKAYGTGHYSGHPQSVSTSIVTTPLVSVELSENPVVNGTVSAVLPEGTKLSDVEYRWYYYDGINWIGIVNASNADYTVANKYLGSKIKAVVTAKEGGIYTGSVETEPQVVTKNLTGVNLAYSLSPEQYLNVNTKLTASLIETDETALYSWYRVDAEGNETLIEGVNSNVYTTSNSDVGCRIIVKATGIGTYSRTVSAETTEIVTTSLANVSLSETAIEVGKTITAVLSPEGATAAFQWFYYDKNVGWKAIEGATEASYTLTTNDIGRKLKVSVIGTGSYTGTHEIEVPSTVKYRLTDNIELLPESPAVGQTLTVLNVPEGATVDYTWYRITEDGTIYGIIKQGADSSYDVTVADIGYKIKVEVTGTGDYYGTVSLTTDIVTKTLLADLTITVGESETASSTLYAQIGPAGATASYQWYWCIKKDSALGWTLDNTITIEIEGATSNIYEYDEDDAPAGCRIGVIATGTELYTGRLLSVLDQSKLISIQLSTTKPTVGTVITTLLSPEDAGKDDATYIWYRGNGTYWEKIDGATEYSYTVQGIDIGYQLKVKATGKGDYYGTVSAVTEIVTSELKSVSIIGNAEAGETLTTKLVPEDATADYQWYRLKNKSDAGEKIDGAVYSSYEISLDDVGYYLKVVAEGTGGYSGEQYAVTSTRVTGEMGELSISGDVKFDSTLTAVLTSGETGVTYKWYLGTDFEHSIGEGKTFVISKTDYIGQYITVIATGNGPSTGVKQATTDDKVIAELNAVILNNTNPEVGQTVKSTVTIGNGTTAIPSADVVAYQWKRVDSNGNETLIDGPAGTGSEYTTTIADVGYSLKLVVTGKENLSYTGTKSQTTAKVVYPLQSVTITGELFVGEVIQAVVEPEMAKDAVTYKWSRRAAGTTAWTTIFEEEGGYTYCLTKNDAGAQIKVEVYDAKGVYTGTKSYVTPTTVKSAKINSVTIKDADKPHYVGETLLAVVDPSEATKLVTYEWYRGSEMVTSGVGNVSYVLTTADRGEKISVVVKGTDTYYTPEEGVKSDPTSKITEKVLSKNITVDGELIISTDDPQTLTVSVANRDGEIIADDQLTYTWYWVDIANDSYAKHEITTGKTLDISRSGYSDLVKGKYITVGVKGNYDLDPSGPYDYSGTAYWTSAGMVYDQLEDGDLTISYSNDKLVYADAGSTVLTATVNGKKANIYWYSETAGGQQKQIGTGSSYTVKKSDVGYKITAKAIGINSAATTGEISVPTDNIVRYEIASISIDLADENKNPCVGETLTTSINPMSAEAVNVENYKVSYEWHLVDGSKDETLTGETASSILVKDRYRGKSLYVIASAKADSNYFGTVTSEKVEIQSIVDPEAPIVEFNRDSYSVQSGYTFYIAAENVNPNVKKENLVYYWDFSGADEIDDKNFKEGTSSLYVAENTLGLAEGKLHTIRVKALDVTTGVFSEAKEAVLYIGAIDKTATLSYAISTFNDGQILSLNMTAKPGVETAVIKQWTIEWGDGNDDVYSIVSNNLKTGHSYDKNGSYQIKITTLDTNNNGTTFSLTYDYSADQPKLGSVTIEGTPNVGAELKAVLDPEIELAEYQKYEWFYGDDAEGKGTLTQIEGADQSTFTIPTTGYENYLGKYITVKVSGTGAYTGESTYTTKAAVKCVMSEVSLDNTKPALGDTINAVLPFELPASATVAYQWYYGDKADGSDAQKITGATESSFEITDNKYLEKYLTVKVEATGNYEITNASATTLYAVKSFKVTLDNDSPSVKDTITANTAEKEVTYQWYYGDKADGSDGILIDEATAVSFKISGVEYLGKYLTVKVTKGTGAASEVVSTTTANKVYYNLAKASVTISGTAQYGEKLTAEIAPALGENPDVTYQWLVNDEVKGSSTVFTIDKYDYVGKKLTFKVIAKEESELYQNQNAVVSEVVTCDIDDAVFDKTQPEYGQTLTVQLTPAAAKAAYVWTYGDDPTGEKNTTVIDCDTASLKIDKTDYIGKYITVKVTGADGYSGTQTITTENRVLFGVTLDNNNPKVGQTITADVTLPEGDASNVYYTWYADGEYLAETKSYTISSAKYTELLGKKLTVEVTVDGSPEGVYDGKVTAATKKAVTCPVSVNLSDEEPVVGDEITVIKDVADATLNLTWYRGEEELKDQKNLYKYTLTSADAGYVIRVIVTGSGNYTCNSILVTEEIPEAVLTTGANMLSDEIPETTEAMLQYWNTLPALETSVAELSWDRSFLLTDRAIAAPKAVAVNEELLAELLAEEFGIEAEEDAQDNVLNLDFVEEAGAVSDSAISAEVAASIFDDEDLNFLI